MFKLRKDLALISKPENKKRFIIKILGDYLNKKYYTYYSDDDLLTKNSGNLVEKSIVDIKKVINFQVIHAKRNVSSSESNGSNKTALSELASKYFNKENSFSQDAFKSINDTILEMDETLNKQYKTHFKGYFKNVKEFIDDVKGELNIISNLESKEILSNHSKVVYGNLDSYLPENQNGLGHLNILFLLLQIEVKRKLFEQEKKDINLLFIEEPEAHTHPQMQYVFAKKVKDILKAIPNSQTFITSHSSHIDTTNYNDESSRWKACSVDKGTNISNKSIEYYLEAPDRKTKETEFKDWLTKLKNNTAISISDKVNISYQLEENGYHGRSFEDAFVSINLDLLVEQKDNVLGLKNIKNLIKGKTDFYALTEDILDKKSLST